MQRQQQAIDHPQKNYILNNQQRDADDKIPFSGFVMKDKHPQINSDTSKSRSHKKQFTLGNPFLFLFSRFRFIQHHNQESAQINNRKKNGYR